MFTDTKYTEWYYRIIYQRQKVKYDGYTENHHILPRCLGGTDEPSNLVELSAREHFICHLLLTKMIDNSSINYAYIAMVNMKNEYQQRDYKITSRHYAYSKELNSKETSIRFKGKAKHNVGKKRYYHQVTLQEIFRFENDVPDGYILGASPLTRNSQRGKNSGKVYYYDPITNDTISLSIGQPIPDGFIKGNPKSKTNLGKSGRKQYFNTLSNKYVRKYEHEKTEYDIEMKMKTIYNDITLEESFIKFDEPIPNGWILGRSPKNKYQNQYSKGK